MNRPCILFPTVFRVTATPVASPKATKNTALTDLHYFTRENGIASFFTNFLAACMAAYYWNFLLYRRTNNRLECVEIFFDSGLPIFRKFLFLLVEFVCIKTLVHDLTCFHLTDLYTFWHTDSLWDSTGVFFQKFQFYKFLTAFSTF